MADTEKFEITLTAEQATLVKEHVANGDYASVDALIAGALIGFGVTPDPDWLPPPDVLKQLIQQALDDPRPSVPLAEVTKRIRRAKVARPDVIFRPMRIKIWTGCSPI